MAGRSGEDLGSRRHKPRLLLALVVGGGLVMVAAAIAWGAGAFSDDSGPLGCIGRDQLSGENVLAGTCALGRALELPFGVAASPDGENVYVAARESDAVSILKRDPESGTLTQRRSPAGCISEGGAEQEACRDGQGLKEPTGIVVSPDGKNAYVTAALSDALTIFDRDPATGELEQKHGKLGCISQSELGGACVNGEALVDPAAVAVSPDGRNVYVAANGIAVFRRDPSTGQLTQVPGADGCVAEENRGDACEFGYAYDLAVSPDGKNIYVAAMESDAVAIFDRDPRTGALAQIPGKRGCVSEGGSSGACRDGNALRSPGGVAVSPDGTSVYVTGGYSNSVAIFDRDRKTGALAQKRGVAGCISEAGTKGTCQDGRGLERPNAVAVSPDGTSVYVSGYYSGAVTTFDRQRATGALAQKPGAAGCIGNPEKDCFRTVALLSLPLNLTVTPDGRNLYVVTPLFEGLALTFERQPSTGTLSSRVTGF
jgi:DNA-binding beta-propeller fold protein YncE